MVIALLLWSWDVPVLASPVNEKSTVLNIRSGPVFVQKPVQSGSSFFCFSQYTELGRHPFVFVVKSYAECIPKSRLGTGDLLWPEI